MRAIKNAKTEIQKILAAINVDRSLWETPLENYGSQSDLSL